jgi:hypothetical protein
MSSYEPGSICQSIYKHRGFPTQPTCKMKGLVKQFGKDLGLNIGGGSSTPKLPERATARLEDFKFSGSGSSVAVDWLEIFV